MEYLRRVQWERAQCPAVVRRDIDPAQLQASPSTQQQAAATAGASSERQGGSQPQQRRRQQAGVGVGAAPSQQQQEGSCGQLESLDRDWLQYFSQHFRNLRLQLQEMQQQQGDCASLVFIAFPCVMPCIVVCGVCVTRRIAVMSHGGFRRQCRCMGAAYASACLMTQKSGCSLWHCCSLERGRAAAKHAQHPGMG